MNGEFLGFDLVISPVNMLRNHHQCMPQELSGLRSQVMLEPCESELLIRLGLG